MKLNQLRKRANEKGFTLIELMIVVAIIGILAAIAIPNFLGMQEKAKRRSVEEAATSAKAELQSWMDASLKGEVGVVDSDGDGVATTSEPPITPLSNVVKFWVSAFYAKKGKTQYSPWNGTKPLFTLTGPPAAADTGLIVLSTINNARGVRIFGFDVKGHTVYQDSVSVD